MARIKNRGRIDYLSCLRQMIFLWLNRIVESGKSPKRVKLVIKLCQNKSKTCQTSINHKKKSKSKLLIVLRLHRDNTTFTLHLIFNLQDLLPKLNAVL